jgi:transposase
MAGKRRQFTLEFKLEAVQLASTSKKPLAQVARELGIRPEMLRTWRRQAESRMDAQSESNGTTAMAA